MKYITQPNTMLDTQSKSEFVQPMNESDSLIHKLKDLPVEIVEMIEEEFADVNNATVLYSSTNQFIYVALVLYGCLDCVSFSHVGRKALLLPPTTWIDRKAP